MQSGGGARLLRAAGCLAEPPAPGAAKGGEGLPVFVRLPDGTTLCVEVNPDATVADLQREAERQAAPRRVGRLRFAGEVLSDPTVALADAGIGPEAAVEAEDALCVPFVERWHGGGGFTHRVVNVSIPGRLMPCLRTADAPGGPMGWQVRNSAASPRKVWIVEAGEEAARAGVIAPSHVAQLRCTAVSGRARTPSGDSWQSAVEQIANHPNEPVNLRLIPLCPVHTVAVSPQATVYDAFQQCVADLFGGYNLEDDDFPEAADRLEFDIVNAPGGSQRRTVRAGAKCADLPLGGDVVIEWDESVFSLFDTSDDEY